jgi:uncharacterized protein (TIGR02453 family)
MAITSDYFTFLRGLSKNNDRTWFKAHQDEFKAAVEAPFVQLLNEFAGPLAKVCPQIRCDTGQGGGTLMRIHRDTRFSKDKAPYKTHMGAMLLHRSQGRGDGMLGFYLRLGPDESLLGGGISPPEAATLKRMRDAIAGGGKRWAAVRVGLERDGALKRVPVGFDDEHPFAEDLKLKAFHKVVRFSPKQVVAPDFLRTLLSAVKELEPLVAFLAAPARLPWP